MTFRRTELRKLQIRDFIGCQQSQQKLTKNRKEETGKAVALKHGGQMPNGGVETAENNEAVQNCASTKQTGQVLSIVPETFEIRRNYSDRKKTRKPKRPETLKELKTDNSRQNC